MQTAEDLTSEVFFRALKRWSSFKEDFTQAWLYQIAKNLLIDHWRRKKNLRLEEDHQIKVETDYIEVLSNQEEVNKLRSALLKLPDNLREVVILRFFENLPVLQVGKILKVSEGNVRILQFRALKKLKEELRK